MVPVTKFARYEMSLGLEASGCMVAEEAWELIQF